MKQLILRLPTTLCYNPAEFIPHRGVKKILDYTSECMLGDGFFLLVIRGGKRKGKSHLSTKIVDLAASSERDVSLVEGSQLESFLHSTGQFAEAEIAIVDDADSVFSLNQDPGSFVSFVEAIRVKKGGVILFCSSDIDLSNLNPHIGSRIHSGLHFEILDPGVEDIEGILSSMAKQRGISISARNISLIGQRLRTDIGAIEEYLERVSRISTFRQQGAKLPLLVDAL